jgi:hypothetical protein
VYAKLLNSNLANIFALGNAGTFCSPQFQASITQGIGNQSSITTNAVSEYPYQDFLNDVVSELSYKLITTINLSCYIQGPLETLF